MRTDLSIASPYAFVPCYLSSSPVLVALTCVFSPSVSCYRMAE